MLTSPIDEIKSRLDIIDVIQGYIKLQKVGVNYRAVCPFHSEKKPSFFVSPNRQLWRCFGCGKGGDMFAFVKEVEGVEFGDALRILAQKAGVELKKQDPKLKTERQRLYNICELACCFFEKQLEGNFAGKEAKHYLLDRGLKEETIKKWRLGYSPDSWQGLSDFLIGRGYTREEIEKAGLCLKSEKGRHYDRFRKRIIFPVFDLSSQVVGFGGRILKDIQRPDGQAEAKYINSPATLLYDKSRILYGLNKAGIETRKKNFCILVEGYMDAIMVNQIGFENVVATSGTALTNFQLKILKRYSDNLLTAFDMDIAGDSATKRGIELAQSAGFNIKVIVMPKDFDPADISFKNSGQWTDLVNKAKSIYDFYFDNALSRFDKDTIEGKKEISKVLLAVIKKAPNKIEQSCLIQRLAGVLDIKEEDVAEELKKVKPELSADNIDDFTEKTDVFSKKSRKELLEEYLLFLAVKYPESFDLICRQDSSIFYPRTLQMIDYFKENSLDLSAGSLVNAPSEEIKDLIDSLLLRAEVEETEEGIDFEKECRNCIKGIKTLLIKDKLDKISKAIKKAEEGKESEKLYRLVQEFNSCSKSLNNLEV